MGYAHPSKFRRLPAMMALQAQRADVLHQGVVGTGGLPAIALRFDDGADQFKSTDFAKIQALGMPAAHAVVTRLRTNTWNQTTQWSDYQTWNHNGVEFWSHSATHKDPRAPQTYTDENGVVHALTCDGQHGTPVRGTEGGLYDQIVGSKRDIEAHGIACVGFIHPGVTAQYAGSAYGYPSGNNSPTADNDFDSVAGRLLMENYGLIETYLPNTVLRGGVGRTGHYGLNHVTFTDSTLAAMESLVDDVVNLGLFQEILVHCMDLDVAGHPTTADFQTFLNYIQTYRNNGQLCVLSPSGLWYANSAVARQDILFDGSFAKFTPPTTPPAKNYWAALPSGWTIASKTFDGATRNVVSIPLSDTNTWSQIIFYIDGRGLAGRTMVAEFTAKATGTSNTARPRMIVRNYPTGQAGMLNLDSTGNGSQYTNQNWTVGTTETKFRMPFTTDPTATAIQILIGQAGAGNQIDISECHIYPA